MPRMNFWRRDDRSEHERSAPSHGEQRSALSVPIRDAERRRLTRLMSRRSGIEYDLDQAETAFMSQNRWTERIEQLDDAIRQADEDIDQLTAAPSQVPDVRLPASPITIEIRSTDVPAEITLLAGDHRFLFREEVDWAERGHQVALPKLTQAEGDVGQLLPDGLTPEDRQSLTDHLQNSLSVIANDALKRAVDGDAPPSFTLEDLTRPCEKCGGWLDPMGRCPACTRIDWERDQIAAAAARLIDERNDTFADLERTRERLPILRRQLQEIDGDIEELRAKGVEPQD